MTIQNKKVEIILTNRKYFCNNLKCSRRTFAGSFDPFQFKGNKTIRLEEQIYNIAVNISSIAAQNYLRENIANVSKSTICTLLKKNKDSIKRYILMIFQLRKEKLMVQL